MADAGIGHQALDVGLADGGEGAEQHRGDGDEDDDLLPLAGDQTPNGCISTRSVRPTAATLGAAAKKAVTGVGAPS